MSGFDPYATQNELHDTFARISHGHRAGAIKGAFINLMVTIFLRNCSNVDEAIIQWNELSVKFEETLRARWKSKIAEADQLDLQKLRLNGG